MRFNLVHVPVATRDARSAVQAQAGKAGSAATYFWPRIRFLAQKCNAPRTRRLDYPRPLRYAGRWAPGAFFFLVP